MTHSRLRTLGLTTLLALAASPGAAFGQLANASASTLALAGNHTALAREFAAISVNPAGLGRWESGFSLAIVPIQARAGLAPITLRDLDTYEGRVLPRAVKEAWLGDVRAAGGQRSSTRVDVTGFSLTSGSIGVQISTIAGGTIDLPPDLVEAALYGNAGRSGSATDLDLSGGNVAGFGVTTAGMSVGIPLTPTFSMGVTGKYSIGHAVALGSSTSGALDANPIRATLDFGLVTSCLDEFDCEQNFANGGSGFGLDLGALMDLGALTLGASLQNVVNTFAWDETRLGYRPGTLLIDLVDDTLVFEDDFDERAFSDAPTGLQETLREYTFAPGYRIGAALAVTPEFTVTGDIRGQGSEGKIMLGPHFAAGVGAELRIPVLQLRAGISKITDGMQYGGGASLVLGPVNLSVAGGLERGDLRDAVLGQFVLSFGGR